MSWFYCTCMQVLFQQKLEVWMHIYKFPQFHLDSRISWMQEEHKYNSQIKSKKKKKITKVDLQGKGLYQSCWSLLIWFNYHSLTNQNSLFDFPWHRENKSRKERGYWQVWGGNKGEKTGMAVFVYQEEHWISNNQSHCGKHNTVQVWQLKQGQVRQRFRPLLWLFLNYTATFKAGKVEQMTTQFFGYLPIIPPQLKQDESSKQRLNFLVTCQL